MFDHIEGLPEDVLGIKLTGKITHEDYIKTLIPESEELIDKYGKLKLLCVIGPEWDGYELGAMWDDAKFGISHWSDFSHIALVSDTDWIKRMSALFAPLTPAVVKIFPLEDINFAKDWISEDKDQQAA